jgi:hypothetical protein
MSDADDTQTAPAPEPKRKRKHQASAAKQHAHPHHHHARDAVASHRAEVAHHTRGRVRLKVPLARDNPALLQQIKDAFANVPGIESIEIKPTSGSVVLFYDPEHHEDVPGFFRALRAPSEEPPQKRRPPSNRLSEVAQTIEDEAAFLAEHSSLARSLVQYAKQLDRELKRATGNNLDLKILVPIGLAAVTFLEIGAAAATPMWVTLVIFSLNHFVELHAHDADETLST